MKINKVFLGGNLVRDPELKYTAGGTALCEFTIANSEKWKNASGEWAEKTGFYNCVCWGRRGEVISENFSKGKPIFVEGKLDFQQWETNEGQKRNTIKINVLDFDFVGYKSEKPDKPQSVDDKDDIPEEDIPF